jgi:hypothetical protein
MNLNDLQISDVRPDELNAVNDWLSRQEGHPVKYALDRKTCKITRDGKLIAVFRLWNTPMLSMTFERDGAATQTARAFQAIRSAMQYQGVKPLVMVNHESPLRAFCRKVMEAIADTREVFRM